MKMKLLFLTILALSSYRLMSQDYWEPVNGLFGAPTESVKYAPDGTIYLSTESSGVYKSTDNGKTWFGAYGGLDYNCVQNLVLSGKGEIFTIECYYGDIYFSTDNGALWSDISYNMDNIQYLPLHAVNGSVFLCANPDCLYKLSDDRKMWMPLKGFNKNEYISSMCSSGNYLFATGVSGVYRSSDNGNNWELVCNLPVVKEANTIINDRAGCLYLSDGRQLMASTDYGVSWNQLCTPGFHVLIFDNHENMYGIRIGVGIYKSTDKGKTWSESYLSSLLTYGIDINDNDEVIATTSIGPVLSTDKGNTWNLSVEGLRANTVTVLYKTLGNTMFAGNETGLYKTVDDCATWKKVIESENTYHSVTAMNSNSKGELFALMNKSMYKSTDNGDSWVSSKVNNISRCWEEIIFFNDTAFVGEATEGVCKSFDLNDWTVVNNGLPFSDGSQIDIRKMLVVKNNVLLGNPCREGVYRTSDGGKNWVKSDVGVENVWILNLVMRHQQAYFQGIPGQSSYHDGDIFAATQFGCGSAGQGIYRSTDNGLSWEIKSVGLKTKTFIAIIIAENGDLYTGGLGSDSHGVYRSTDNGESWVLLPTSGLPKLSVWSLMEGHDGRIYAGLSGGSLYRTKLNFNSVESSGGLPELYVAAVSPNPAVDRCNLTINLKEPATMRIALYSSDGRLIEELGNGYYDAGVVSIPIKKGSMAVGTYFVSISSEKKMQTLKFNFVE